MPKDADKPDASTQEAPRPEDSDIVTSDLPAEAESDEPGDQATDDPAAAAADKDGSKGQKSATDDDDKDQGNHKQRHSRKRWRNMRRDLSKAEQRAEAAETRNKELEARVEALEKSKAAKPEPKLTDYKTPAEFARAHTAWQDEQDAAAAATSKKPEPKPSDDQPAQQPAADPEEVDAFIERGTEKLGDVFQEAITDDPDDPTPINQVMGEFLFDSDVGPDLYVHLHQNKDAAKEIYDAKAPKAVKMLEALAKQAEAGTLGEEPDDDEEPADDKDDKGKGTGSTKRKTNASEPPGDHRESGTAATPDDLENVDMDEYAAKRRKQIARDQGRIL